ncbi:MAG: UDP-N-acetylmuramoyl-tripeptide--D-alanyl-D-alanine ligase [Bacillota bacterium]
MMQGWSAGEIAAITGGCLLAGNSQAEIRGVTIDSRTIRPGNLFIAFKGEKTDGHDYVGQAFEQGAAACLVERPVQDNRLAVILVENTLNALGRLAGHHRLAYRGHLIGVTGSNGKTTTKDMIASILAQKWHILKTLGNYNNEIGLPLTLLKLTPDTQAAVVEFGMRRKGQIKALAHIALPTAAVLTNVGEAHMEMLGSKEAIADAKGELIEAVPADGMVVLNADDPYLAEQGKKSAAKVIGYGLKGRFGRLDYRGEDPESDGVIQKFNLYCARGRIGLEIMLPGLHNIYNALAASALCLELGLDPEDVQEGLRHFIPGDKRLNIIRLNEITIIDDTYNASPTSTLAALEILAYYPGKRKIAILGDMLELGRAAVDGHRLVGKKAAELGIRILATGPLAWEIVNAARPVLGPDGSRHFGRKEDIIEFIRGIREPDDVYLVKGSRGMRMETIVKALKGEE